MAFCEEEVLNLRNCWAVITEGKVANVIRGMEPGMELGVWVVVKSEATRSKEAFSNFCVFT